MQVRYGKLLMVVAAAAIFASCGKSNTQGKLIPKDASVVVQIDGKSLSSKLPWDDIKKNPLFEEATKDSTISATLKSILDNPDNSGIDTKTDLIIFLEKDSIGGYVALEGTVKDKAAFEKFATETTKGTVSQKGDLQYVAKSPLCVSWNKDKFIYLIDVPQISQLSQLTQRMQMDSIDVPAAKPRDISAAVAALFSLEESASLAKDDRFSKLMKEAGDVRLWVNVEQLNKGMVPPTAMAMLNLDKMYKGSLTTGVINFDNGKIVASAKSYVNDELMSLYKKYAGGKINEDMIKRIPGKDIMGVMAINYKPEGIREILKLMNLDGLANMGLAQLGFNMDDFIKANKGDLVVGFSDLKMVGDTTTYAVPPDAYSATPTAKPTLNYVFAVSVNDKDAFNKLIEGGRKAGQQFGMSGDKAPFAYGTNGNFFAISNTKENTDKYLAGTSSNPDFLSKISGQSMGGYLNIQSVLKAFENEAKSDSTGKIIYDASIKLWDNVLMKAGDITDGAITQSIEINLVDKSTNSLKQLNQYAATLSAVIKEKQRKMKEDNMAFEDFEKMPVDTTLSPVPSN